MPRQKVCNVVTLLRQEDLWCQTGQWVLVRNGGDSGEKRNGFVPFVGGKSRQSKSHRLFAAVLCTKVQVILITSSVLPKAVTGTLAPNFPMDVISSCTQ